MGHMHSYEHNNNNNDDNIDIVKLGSKSTIEVARAEKKTCQCRVSTSAPRYSPSTATTTVCTVQKTT